MHISLTTSRTVGFKRWSDAHHPSNDDEGPGGAKPVAIAILPQGARAAIEGSLHSPWRVPGVAAGRFDGEADEAVTAAAAPSLTTENGRLSVPPTRCFA